jgi:HD-GYP domain-containing protein (c-di-GMP phosphodiesterase class II)
LIEATMTVNSAAMHFPSADGASMSGSTPQFVDPLAALRRESPQDLEAADTRCETTAAPQRLLDTRLDIARGLFAALRHKHSPTAGHSLRVAVTCCAWGEALHLSANDRETLEIAALLHDIGKLGAPDQIGRAHV